MYLDTFDAESHKDYFGTYDHVIVVGEELDTFDSWSGQTVRFAVSADLNVRFPLQTGHSANIGLKGR